MQLESQDYREGALLRLGEAQVLYDAKQWVGCIYLAGRAAESILRSLRRSDSERDEQGHDLRFLLKRVRQLIQFSPPDARILDDAVNTVALVWRNDLRFTGEKRMLRLLKKSGRLHRIGAMRVRGNPLKANAKPLIEACERIVQRGEPYLWQHSRQS